MYVFNFDGMQKWVFEIGNDIRGLVVIDNIGNIIFGLVDNNVYLLFLIGSINWVYIIGGYVYSILVVGVDGIIYFGSRDNIFYVFSNVGDFLWSLNEMGFYDFDVFVILVLDGIFYVGNDNDELIVFEILILFVEFVWFKVYGNVKNMSLVGDVFGQIIVLLVFLFININIIG